MPESQSIDDYLTKQLYIEKNVVTYRSLSRAQGIHVNVAKNELAAYYAKGEQKFAATFLLSGTARPSDDDEMDVDLDGQIDMEYEGGDYNVPQMKVLVVNEPDVAAAKSEFLRLNTIHVYSLSPSPIHDSGHLCTPTDVVREFDGKNKQVEYAAMVGRIVGKHVFIKPPKVERPANPAGPSRLKPLAVVKEEQREKQRAKLEIKEAEPEKPADKPKPKQSGKLDFTKAKPKAKEPPKEKKTEVKAAATKVKKEVKDEPKLKSSTKGKAVSALGLDSEEGSSSSRTSLKPAAKQEPQRRGTKRKSALDDSEDEEPAPAPKEKKLVKKEATEQSVSALFDESEDEKPAVKGKNKPIVSSDEEEEPVLPRAPRRKTKAQLAALAQQEMMDVDEDEPIQPTRVTRKPSIRKEEEEESDVAEKKDEDVDMDEDIPMPKKTRKPKKVVPLGRNGLKKKRNIKSRTRTDAKGFQVTEDYSEYESVEEEEPEPEPVKAKAKAKAPAAKETAKSKAKATVSKPTAGSSKTGQQGLASFFGKK